MEKIPINALSSIYHGIILRKKYGINQIIHQFANAMQLKDYTTLSKICENNLVRALQSNTAYPLNAENNIKFLVKSHSTIQGVSIYRANNSGQYYGTSLLHKITYRQLDFPLYDGVHNVKENQLLRENKRKMQKVKRIISFKTKMQYLSMSKEQRPPTFEQFVEQSMNKYDLYGIYHIFHSDDPKEQILAKGFNSLLKNEVKQLDIHYYEIEVQAEKPTTLCLESSKELKDRMIQICDYDNLLNGNPYISI